jgi:hypothetical protein
MSSVVTDVNNFGDNNFGDDDGFTGTLISGGRVLKGMLLKWSDSAHWVDRDGLPPPSPLLVVAIAECLQRWRGGRAQTITDKPLPNPDQLNAAVPESEWEPGIDGKPRPPWEHVVVIYLVDPARGTFYTYMAGTIGAHMMWDHLREQVMTMRALRGVKCMPLVTLSERPMKTSFGMRHRPFLEIVDWRTPGAPGAALTASPSPQIAGPATPQSAAPVTATLQPRQPKQPVNLSDATLATMGSVRPPTTAELLDDSLD